MSGINRILVVGEVQEHQVHRVTYELINKAHDFCSEKTEVACLVMGSDDLELSELCYRGADRVFYIKNECFEYPSEVLFSKNIKGFIQEYDPDIVLIGATTFGRSIGPRVAASLKTGLTADCTDLIINDNGEFEQIRPAFSGNILAHIVTKTRPKMSTVRYKEFDEAKIDGSRAVRIEMINPYIVEENSTIITRQFNEEIFDITESEIIVAGGRGIKRKEDLKLLADFADVLGGQVGASRALVDAGMISSKHQVGYSGNRVKPKVYFACGISGAPQHLAGMKESDTIIAINKDPSANIFSVCDFGIVGDLYEVIPRLIEDVKSWKENGFS